MKLAQKIRNCVKKALARDRKKSSKYVDMSGSAENSSSSDYVSEDELDQVSGDSISLYQCEMPAEKLAKLKAMNSSMSRMRDLPAGLRNQTVETSACYYGYPNPSLAPVSTTLECSTPQPNLVGAKALARGMQPCPNHEDYMDMDEPNYDDYMYFSDTNPSYLQGTTTDSIIAPNDLYFDPPPPYSEKDPIHKL